MSITILDGLVTAMGATNQDFAFYSGTLTDVAGGFINLARGGVTSFGQQAVATVIGSGGHNPVDATAGYPTIAAGAGGTTLYISRLDGFSTIAGTLLIYDRIWAASGFSGTTAPGAQSVTGFPTLPAARAPGTGEGLEVWLESITAVGASASNVTVQYTNSAGTASRNTVSEAITASFPINRMQKLRLQDGDIGVQSVQSLTLSATTGTAGNFGLTLLKRKATLPLPVANTGYVMDFAALGLPTLQSDSALQFAYMSSTTTTGVIFANFSIISG
jgi:hypothetical protein